jgi:hypothetical protein
VPLSIRTKPSAVAAAGAHAPNSSTDRLTPCLASVQLASAADAVVALAREESALTDVSMESDGADEEERRMAESCVLPNLCYAWTDANALCVPLFIIPVACAGADVCVRSCARTRMRLHVHLQVLRWSVRVCTRACASVCLRA